MIKISEAEANAVLFGFHCMWGWYGFLTPESKVLARRLFKRFPKLKNKWPDLWVEV